MDTKFVKQKILDLAIRGKLVPQNPADEPASVLLERIKAEKTQLIKEGKIKKSKVKLQNYSFEEPFDIPSSWRWTPLDNLCLVFGRIGFRGYTKADLVSTSNDGAISLSPSNIVDNVMNYEKCTYISWEKYEESPEIMAENGNIMLVKTGSSYGKCSLIKDLPWNATINPQSVLLKYISIDNQYLTYYLQSNTAIQNYESFVIGTAIPTFTQEKLISMQVPLPPLEEQKRIVTEIDRWFNWIDELEKNQQDLHTAIQQAKSKILDLAIHGKLVPQDPNDEPASILLERIKTEKVQLIKEGKIKKEKPLAPIEEVSFDIPESWVITNIGELLINRDSERVPISLAVRNKQQNKIYDYYGATGVVDSVDSYLFNERLLLIGEDGANLLSRSKNNAFFAEGKYWVNNHAHVLDCSIKSILDYVALIINSMSLENYVTGSAQPKLNQDNLNKIVIALPPLAEQKRIVSKIDGLFTQLDKIEESLN